MTLAQKDRFFKFVSPEPNTGCWLWTGAAQRNGYGRFGMDGRTQFAHRVAYELHIGPIPKGLHLDHLCRVRGCVNPAHLEAVTQRENTLRGDAITARNAVKTHCLKGHAFDEANTYHYQGGFRGCRTCRKARRKASRVARKAGQS